jgi:hypothetical protein
VKHAVDISDIIDARASGAWRCKDDRMHLPASYRAIPQPLRWAVAGAVVLAAIGGLYGIVESIRDYPVTSWFGVILYVAMLGAGAGFVLGLGAGTLRRLVGGAGTR